MPPLGPEADTTLSYELAKWLAPILTSALIFTKISNLLFHFKNSLVNRFSRNHIIIFEKSDFTDILIHNLSGYKKLYRISLVTKDFLDDDRKKQYEKAGVSTYQSDFKNLGRNELKELSYNLNIKKAKYIILTSDNDLENYALFSNITKIAKPKSQLVCLIHCNSNVVASYLEDILLEARQKNEKLNNIDLITFNENDLVVRLLMLTQVFPERNFAEISEYIDEKFAEFKHLQEYQKVDNEEFKIRFREFLHQNPILDFLSRLEHKRWCNTYYAMNFKFGEKKDEDKKTHPCLIDDWNVVIGEKFDICHPEYDLLSVFTLFQKEV